MSTVTTLKMLSTGSDATEQLGEQLGSRLRGGEVIQLVSDLGGGKTTFVRGLAKGAGSTDHVSSPTFTISKVYTSPRLTLYHYDFYRLPDAGIMNEELSEVLHDADATVVVEWADVVEGVLPVERIKIAIHVTDEETRAFTITVPQKYAYLTEGLA